MDAAEPGLTESGARELLCELARELSDQPLVRSSMGIEKIVWHVGRRHVLRIPRTPAARTRIEVERRVLDAIQGRLTLPTPRVVAVGADGHDLCLKAPGEALSWRDWDLWAKNSARICGPFGRFLAALHQALPPERARALGVPEDVCPAPGNLHEHLSGQLETRPQQRLMAALLDAAPALLAPWRERVLLHDDLSLHNVGFDRASGRMVGVFDFGSCVIGDPHRDLRYDPRLESEDDSAARAYEEARGVAISRGRQRAWHAWSALANLAWSLEHEAHDPELQAARWGWVDSVAAWDLGFLSELG